MQFMVTYRGKDGAIATEAVNAASRGDCFAQLKARGISPIRVENGKGMEPSHMKARRRGTGGGGPQCGVRVKCLLWIVGVLAVAGILCGIFCAGKSEDIPRSVASNRIENGSDEPLEVESVSGIENGSDEPLEVESVSGNEAFSRSTYGPRIKGLRLGMDYDDVESIVKGLVNKLNAENPKHVLSLKYDKDVIELICDEIQDGRVVFEDGKLIVFGFSGDTLLALFGVTPDRDSFKQFLQMFIDSYGVPNVETQTYTSTTPSTRGPFVVVETLGYYDGSRNGGYAFKGREYKGEGSFVMPPRWSFSVQRYVGLNFDLPRELNASHVKHYRHGVGPVVKGLQLGMTRSEVIDAVARFWPDGTYQESGDGISYRYNNGPGLYFSFKDGKTNQLLVEGDVLGFLFNVDKKYHSFKAFAQQVIDHYGVPTATGERQSSSGVIKTTYTHIENGIEFLVGEYRTQSVINWAIRLSKRDSYKFD